MSLVEQSMIVPHALFFWSDAFDDLSFSRLPATVCEGGAGPVSSHPESNYVWSLDLFTFDNHAIWTGLCCS